MITYCVLHVVLYTGKMVVNKADNQTKKITAASCKNSEENNIRQYNIRM